MNPNDIQPNNQPNPNQNNMNGQPVTTPPVYQESTTSKVIRQTGMAISLMSMLLAMVTTIKALFGKK